MNQEPELHLAPDQELILPEVAREIIDQCEDLQIFVWQNRKTHLFAFAIFNGFDNGQKPLFVPEPFTKDKEVALEILEFTLTQIRKFCGCESKKSEFFTLQLITEIVEECRGGNIAVTKRVSLMSA
jgi:hypothetical protein